MALGSPARLLSGVSERLRLPGPKQARIRRPSPAPARRAADGTPGRRPHGWAPHGLLASYDTERRTVIEQTVASAATSVRMPDQHIAWRAEDPAGIDIETAAGLHPERDPVRAGI